MANLIEIIQLCLEKKATDLHLKVGRPPVLRINNILIFTELPPITPPDLKNFLDTIALPEQQEKLTVNKELDFGHTFPDLGRFRINVYFQRGEIGIAMRLVQTKIPRFEDLGLPPVLAEISRFDSGLVLVAGPTSSGKSTTIAALVEYINQNQQVHIMTVEDPIEYIYTDKKSIVNQREIGIDTTSFHNALKYVMREDPDIIVIGEMRDPETFEAALSASETGHLVLSTVHALDTISIFTRILDFFPSQSHEQVRKQLAYHIKATICQKLLPRADQTGLLPAVEVMISTPTIIKLVQENQLLKIPTGMRTEKNIGMQTFNEALIKLIQEKKVTRESALAISPNPDALQMNLKGIFLDEETRIIGM
ncbi:MAG: PilT/PilU family type 4a pilus ATPase [Candidatus Omnitrophica bacterium]|nr:PilT/PilU family type 4a pilus ATPase [Candidatus Omnitrophota bacterium]